MSGGGCKHGWDLFVAAILLALALPRLAAAGIDFVSTPSPVSLDGGTAVIENRRFQFSSEGKALSLHFSGTALRPLQPEADPAAAALDHAYLDLRSRPLRTDLSLGRIPLDDALNPALMDGLFTRRTIAGKARLTFFSGRAVSTNEDVMGGRISSVAGDRAAAGISYEKASTGVETLREEFALDLRVRPVDQVRISGRSRVDLRTGAWTEHSYSAKIGPFHRATLLLDAFWTEPGSYDPFLQPESRRAGVQISFAPRMKALFDVRSTEDPTDGHLLSKGLHLSFSLAPSWTTDVSLIDTSGEDLRMFEADLTVAARAGNVEASLGLQKTLREAGYEDRWSATGAALALSYAFTPAYRLISEVNTSVAAGTRPDVRAFMQLEYRFGS